MWGLSFSRSFAIRLTSKQRLILDPHCQTSMEHYFPSSSIGQVSMRDVKKVRRHDYSEDQLQFLVSEYTKCPYPSRERRQYISDKLGVALTSVLYWFQNRRRNDRVKRSPPAAGWGRVPVTQRKPYLRMRRYIENTTNQASPAIVYGNMESLEPFSPSRPCSTSNLPEFSFYNTVEYRGNNSTSPVSDGGLSDGPYYAQFSDAVFATDFPSPSAASYSWSPLSDFSSEFTVPSLQLSFAAGRCWEPTSAENQYRLLD